MRFTESPLPGALVIDPEPVADERGLFARTYCAEEFAARDLVTEWVQCNSSLTRCKGAVRGLHFQADPHAETKLVRCTRGAVFDVAVDIRRESPTFGRWFAVELTANNRRAFYIPAGFAHGFQALADDSELFYQMSAFYEPKSARGIRWDDGDIAIAWPLAATMLSDRDRNFPLLRELAAPELT
jgi:dTDP-4-dehydrorhamnose 3,5-epimerase